MGLVAEVWTRPGDANFGRVIDGVPYGEQTLHKSMTRIGDGSMKIPDTFDRFDEILKTDEATPSSSVSSLVRVFNTSDLTTPVLEWLPDALLPTEAKTDLNVDVSGLCIKSVMDWARTEAYDWDGSDDWIPQFPDWIYGGDNILTNPGIENNTLDPELYELWNDRAGGSFTLSDGTDTTSSIAEGASPSTIETRLQTDIAAITDVLVTGSGTESDPWVIEFVTPGFGITLTVNDTTITSTLTLTNTGGLVPTPWTKSQQISFGVPKIFGTYASDGFRVSEGAEPVLSGSYSLRVNGLTQYAGAQQVVNVKPGGTYQALAPVYTSDAADEFRFVVRDINGGLIQTTAASTTGNVGDWDESTFALADLVIPDGITQVIFRFAYVGTGNPSPFYLDDMQLTEGLAATTVGAIIGDLYADATSDHAGRVVWEDLANPGNPWLSLDFTDSVDSNGDAWFETGVSVRLWMRMTYRQVLEQFVRDYDIEWRIVPDDVEAGSWLLQVFNPGGMGTDYSAAQSPAIQGSSSDVRRSIRRFLPAATNHLVEGETRITSRRDSTGLESAIGRIEGSRLDRQLPTQTSVAQGAYQDSVDEPSNASPYVYNLVSPQEEPLSVYDVGDILTVHDPPEVDDTGRLVDVEVVDAPDATVYEVQFFPTTPAGS